MSDEFACDVCYQRAEFVFGTPGRDVPSCPDHTSTVLTEAVMQHGNNCPVTVRIV